MKFIIPVMRIQFKLIAWLLLTPGMFSAIKSQEVVQGLRVNPQLLKNDNTSKVRFKLKSTTVLDTLKLPFIDDFSSTTGYPDSRFWTDKQAFINSQFPVNPVSIGVATLDAIDENGRIYSNASSSPFYADSLTSKPINLAYPGRNDVYLSFFYQPQGIGDSPEPGDSLMVDFYNPSLASWQKVWAVPGDTVHPFKQAMLKVDNSYLQKGFRFRFRNIASLSSSSDYAGKHGDVDHWNIDYVRLDTARNANDTILHDVAVVAPMASLLKNYQAMPLDHFIRGFRTELKSQIGLTYQNNDNAAHLVTRNFVIKEMNDNRVQSFTAGAENVAIGQKFNLQTDLVNPFITNRTDSALFEVKGYLVTDPKDRKSNDTTRFYQVFNNYLAYDDGTSEAGYGFQGQGTQNAQAAYGFYAYKEDTLTAIQIYFNPTEDNVTKQYYFKLAVWGDNNGKPGTLLYAKADDDFQPKATSLNQFYTFYLNTKIPVSGTFYVGWIQTDLNYLNIGYDFNNNNQSHHFINIFGNWEKSAIKGSLMIRPVFRTTKSTTSSTPQTIAQNSLKVRLNDITGEITLETADKTETLGTASVYDLSGRLVKTAFVQSNSLDVSNLSRGVYILKVSGKNYNYQPVKFLKLR